MPSYVSAHWYKLSVFYYIRMLFSYYLIFFLTASFSHGTLDLALDLVSMHSTTAFIWELMKFLYLSFGVSIPDISRRVLYLFFTNIYY